MMVRGHIRKDLYDFVTGTLPPDDRSRVERHLRRCRRCAAERESMVRTLAALPRVSERPADLLPTEFWSILADSIEQRTSTAPHMRVRPGVFTGALQLAFGTRRAAIATVAFVALFVAGLGRLLWNSPVSSPEPAETTIATDLAVPDTSVELLSDYFRRSKMVLVGLENKQPFDTDEHIDLSAERSASRRLVEEGRMIRSRPFDAHSTALVADVERIMIEVANSHDEVAPDDVQLIKDGIRKQNLLFKIRMAEQTYANPRFVRASGTYPPR